MPSGRPSPHGEGRLASGTPSSSPISRPSVSPTTAVTNSAVDRSSTREISQDAGTSVRYGRIANPTTTQATTHAARRNPA